LFGEGEPVLVSTQVLSFLPCVGAIPQ